MWLVVLSEPRITLIVMMGFDGHPLGPLRVPLLLTQKGEKVTLLLSVEDGLAGGGDAQIVVGVDLSSCTV